MKSERIGWSSDEIRRRVKYAGQTYGDSNPQQRRQLLFTLGRCNPVEVSRGLLAVFAQSNPSEFNVQKLAGFLLNELDPECDVPISDIVESVVPAFNLSVQELPLYLVRRFKDDFVNALVVFEGNSGTLQDQKAASTMLWWIKRLTDNE